MSRKALVNIEGPELNKLKKNLEQTAVYIADNFWNYPKSFKKDFRVDLSIVNDEKIRKINKSYLGRDKATDVIAFSLCEGENMPEVMDDLLGQIVISVESAEKNCRRYSNSLQKELFLLFIHGMLHLSGWDEGEEIEEIQESILHEFYKPLS
ncbi:MAG: rRNA maturation RNase YbeY [Elusimicrobiota bacterium]